MSHIDFSRDVVEDKDHLVLHRGSAVIRYSVRPSVSVLQPSIHEEEEDDDEYAHLRLKAEQKAKDVGLETKP